MEEEKAMTFEQFAEQVRLFGMREVSQKIVKEGEEDHFKYLLPISEYWYRRINMYKEDNLPEIPFFRTDDYGNIWLLCETDKEAAEWSKWVRNLMKTKPCSWDGRPLDNLRYK